jgi:spermidine/putrescine transport system ATP-binding protein
MSDRVCVLADGRIAQLGTPREIYFAPQNEFVARFVGRSNLIPIEFRRAGDGHVGLVGGQEIAGLRSSQAGGARMAIRYEAVQLAPLAVGASPAPGTLRGTVEDVLFLGTSLEVNVQSNGLNLFGTVPAAQEATFWVGQEVQVSFDIQNTRVFHD